MNNILGQYQNTHQPDVKQELEMREHHLILLWKISNHLIFGKN